MIWQWTGKSLVAMRAVQQGLLVGWICHTFDVKMVFSPKNWTSQVKHCTMTSNFWFWETVPAWYVKICLKNTSHHLFLYFLNFWVHFTHVHYDQPKMVDLPNIPHAINSWQFLQGKKTTYWMYFGLYIRWKFRKHYGKHSGHGSVHLWHHSGILFFCSFYEVLKHANQSTNFCLTTLESWNFSSKERCLSLISVANLVASFPPKIVCGSCQVQ